MIFDIQCSLPNNDAIDTYRYDNRTNTVWAPNGEIIDWWRDDHLKEFRAPRELKIDKDFCEDKPIVGKQSLVSRLKIQLGTACNYHCKYCMQASYRTKAKYPSKEKLCAFIEKLERNHIAFTENGGIEYWGGEPLVYWKALKELIVLLRQKYGEKVAHSMVTNGSLLTKEIVDFLIANRVQVVISHDAQGFSLRSDKDPLFDSEMKAVWLYLLHESRKAGVEMAFNVVLTPKNCDIEEIRSFFDRNFATDVRINFEGIVTAESDTENTVFSEADVRTLDNSIFKAIVSDFKKWPTLQDDVFGWISRLTHRVNASTIHGKCESPSRSVLVIDLDGRIVSCQNREASQYSIGSIDNLDGVSNGFFTHWSFRPSCKDCFVLNGCKGSCPHADEKEHARTCSNEMIFHRAIFSAVWYLLTGRIIRGINYNPAQLPYDGYLHDERDIEKFYLMIGHACNFKCRHCYQEGMPMPHLDKQVAPQVIEYLRRVSTLREEKARLVFWGGEPLLYLPLIKQVVKELGDGTFDYWMMSNGALLTSEIVDYLNEHNIGFSVSNDGPDTAKIRGVNILEDKAFLARFKSIHRTCVGCCTHAYNIDPKRTVAYIQEKVGKKVPVYYQYHLECTHPMDKDLYAYDLEAYRKNLEELCEEYFRDENAGKKDTAAVYAVRKGIAAAKAYYQRKALGIPEKWLPECEPFRREMNIDIHGAVHACHNRLSPIGKIEEPFSVLQERNDALYLKHIQAKTECDFCSTVHICRHGCPLNPMSAGQRECCKAEALYWSVCERAYLKHLASIKGKKRIDIALERA